MIAPQSFSTRLLLLGGIFVGFVSISASMRCVGLHYCLMACHLPNNKAPCRKGVITLMKWLLVS